MFSEVLVTTEIEYHPLNNITDQKGLSLIRPVVNIKGERLCSEVLREGEGGGRAASVYKSYWQEGDLVIHLFHPWTKQVSGSFSYKSTELSVTGEKYTQSHMNVQVNTTLDYQHT